MKKNDRLNDTFSKLLPIVLLLLGISLLGGGLGILTTQAGFQKTDAVITEIASAPYTLNGREKSASTAYVSYTLDGVSHTSELGGVRKGYVQGATVAVLVDPALPENAVLPKTAEGVVRTAMGSAFLLAGVVLFVPLLRAVFSAEAKKREELYVDSDAVEEHKA
ncbi:MAG: hypothetical protein IJK89_07630 [Clostridia bacterium]|nr:hypothetical protein [Clostridia bacterium]